MDKYELIITLFTVVYGLMLTDLFSSLHKLIRKHENVKWHWLPLLVAWFLFIIILKNWWSMTFFKNSDQWINIAFFIAYGHLLFLIFLAVSAVLPDDIQQSGINLKEYYFSNNGYFWSIFAAIVFVSALIGLFKSHQMGQQLNKNNIISNGIFILLNLTLAISKRYLVHCIIIIFMVTMVLLEVFSKIA